MRPATHPKIGQSFIPILKDCDRAMTLGITDDNGNIKVRRRNRKTLRILNRDGNAFVCCRYDSNSIFAMDLTPEAGNYTEGWYWKNVWGENVRRKGGKVPDLFYNTEFRREFRYEMWDFFLII